MNEWMNEWMNEEKRNFKITFTKWEIWFWIIKKSFEILKNLIVVSVGVTLKCHVLFEWIKMICYSDVMYIIWNKH